MKFKYKTLADLPNMRGWEVSQILKEFIQCEQYNEFIRELKEYDEL